MTELIDWIRWLIGLAKPENLKDMVNLGGPAWVSYCILSAVVFSETGLLVGFFLPETRCCLPPGFWPAKEYSNSPCWPAC